ncbi:Murein DD-endopeptidase MepM and murein hydrolase activator NlpD, contain LysM domain [Nocardioides scoriae]|uniref:Murein DD-endopeptidase MepM and murein hydrolase activator NlpD, contain LysM domain n=1 Tax=Nocardioides scoriae TaxID=642780 RepID=A0A1H1RIF2_9ACTN|nr:M23 family metallopeptidase [Nocardioides scoriae]SDS34719.1 Murein DD-endopeptidase MepM and murein hydrolase activator NlpD, contain LysM domain [Nocardioides scoriae]
MGQHRAEHRGSRRDRADRRSPSSVATPRAAGRRRATAAPRTTSLLPRLSTLATGRRPGGAAARWRHRLSVVPGALGVVALVAAGTGAVTVGEQAPGDAITASAAARAISAGTSAQGRVGQSTAGGSDREAALSRDSERQALQDAAQARLERAAEEQAAERNAELKSLGRAAEARAGEIAKNQWVLPTTGYHLTARFGMAGGLWSSDHTGLDFAAPSGTPIVAIANGTITETGYAGAYGNQTIMTLDDGTEVWFCHQTTIGVEPGDKVAAGQQIGTVGTTGNSTGPHLHLEIRPGGGDPVDPEQALAFHGLTP